MVIQGKKLLCTLFTKSYSYWKLHNYWERFRFFFRVILGHHYLRQAKTMEATSKWNQNHVHKKKNIKPKVSHTSFFISKDQNQTIQIFIYTMSKKMQIDWKGEITVNSHWARFSALDIRQTFRSLFQSVVKLRFRSISSIYIWKKKLQKLKYLNLVFPTPPKKLSFAYGSVNNSYHYQKQNTSNSF